MGRRNEPSHPLSRFAKAASAFPRSAQRRPSLSTISAGISAEPLSQRWMDFLHTPSSLARYVCHWRPNSAWPASRRREGIMALRRRRIVKSLNRDGDHELLKRSVFVSHETRGHKWG